MPLWSVVVALLALAAVAATRDLTLGALLVAAALVAGLPSASLTVLTTAVVVAACAATLRHRVAGLILPVAIAGLLWSIGEVAQVDITQRGVPIALAVGLLAVVLHREEIEASAAATVFITSTAAVAAATNESAALALHLTLLGALVSGAALLHRDRRQAGWVGGLLLAAATWVRLADIGVDTPEAYTLPSAVALLLVGLDRMRRDPGTPTWTALSPGLLLATTALAPVEPGRPGLGPGGAPRRRLPDPGAARQPAALERTPGHRCRRRRLLVLREVAPYAAETPQWVLIGLAGTLLTVVGVTWERRLLDLRRRRRTSTACDELPCIRGAGVPERLGHVQPPRGAARRALFGVATLGLAEVALGQRAVGPYDPPPRHRSTVARHHSADLAGTATDHLRDRAVRRHPTARDPLDAGQHGLDVLLDVVHAGSLSVDGESTPNATLATTAPTVAATRRRPILRPARAGRRSRQRRPTRVAQRAGRAAPA